MDNFNLTIKQIRKDWGVPDVTVMLWSKDKLLPIGYQVLPHKAVNDNLSFLSNIRSEIYVSLDDNEAKP